ncbi:MAG: hypothetical protein LW806_12435 [Planctomycetaceae bacterium]|nr:hypothetical protein [Planctomycetaceae bacterium]
MLSPQQATVPFGSTTAVWFSPTESCDACVDCSMLVKPTLPRVRTPGWEISLAKALDAIVHEAIDAAITPA